MKKTWSYVLTIYVTVVTIACAIFGALYFLSRNGQIADLTFSEAKALVHQVYETQVTKTGHSSISADSLEYKDYNNTELSEESLFFSQQYVKTVRSFEEILNNGWVANTWLKRKGSENDVGPQPGSYDALEDVDSIIQAAQFFRYSMNGQSVTLEVVQKTDSVWYYKGTNVNHPGEYTKGFQITVTRVGETDWKTDYYEKHYGSSPAAPNVAGDYRATLFHVSYESKNQKLVRCKTEEVFTTLKTYKDKANDDEIYIYAIYDCDLSTKKVLNAAGPDDVSMGNLPGVQLLSKNDTLVYGKNLFDDVIKVLGTYESNTSFENFVEVNVEI